MLKLNSIKVDIEAEKNGQWVDSALLPGVRFLVRSLNDPIYQAKMSTIVRDLKRQYPKGNAPEDVLAERMGVLLSERILLGWDGIAGDDMKALPFSEERARGALIDPSYRRFREAVVFAASSVGETELEFVEDDAKN